MDNVVDRHVFYISDGTAITAEVLGHAVMSQFPVTISSITLPFVENESRARAVKDQIDAIYQQTGVRPLVFYSVFYLKFAPSSYRAKVSARISSRRWWRRFSRR